MIKEDDIAYKDLQEKSFSSSDVVAEGRRRKAEGVDWKQANLIPFSVGYGHGRGDRLHSLSCAIS